MSSDLDVVGAQQRLQGAAKRMSTYAPASPVAQSEMSSLEDLAAQMAQAPMAPAAAKEVYYSQQRRSRNQADYRQTSPSPMPEEASNQQQQPSQKQQDRRKLKFPWQSPGKDEKPPH